MKSYQLCCLSRQGRIVVLLTSAVPDFEVYGVYGFKNMWLQRADQPAVKERKP